MKSMSNTGREAFTIGEPFCLVLIISFQNDVSCSEKSFETNLSTSAKKEQDETLRHQQEFFCFLACVKLTSDIFCPCLHCICCLRHAKLIWTEQSNLKTKIRKIHNKNVAKETSYAVLGLRLVRVWRNSIIELSF